jgi:[acyl-carrier-protein] S-malonyltransferase
VFETVDETLGFSLSNLCFSGPEETLRDTINAQPAIVTVSLALLAAFQEALSPKTSSWSSPLTPAYTAGHSVGEYAALTAAGALDLRQTALQVRERGRLMHQEGLACPGGMAAVIGMDAEILQEVCQEATQQMQATLPTDRTQRHPGQGQVVIANYNAPGQIVISGEQQALTRAIELARGRGAKRVIPLSVSAAFHSPVMQPAAHNLAQSLATADIHDTTIPIISNITATALMSASAMRKELAEQVAAPVQWIRTIDYLTNAGVSVFIEIGPGQALTGMIKRITRGVTTLTIGSVAEIGKAVKTVREMGIIHEI